MSIARMVTVRCLECEEPIQLESEIMLGEVISCPACFSEMEIVGLNPTRLEFFYDGEWEDEESDEYVWDDEEPEEGDDW